MSDPQSTEPQAAATPVAPEANSAPELATAVAVAEVPAATEPAEAAPAEAATAAAEPSGAEPRDAAASGDAALESSAKSSKSSKKKKKKAAPAAPKTAFSHLFGRTPRRNAFAAGELVAGIVDRIGEESLHVDLFGRASAYVDRNEPDWQSLEPAQRDTRLAEALNLEALAPVASDAAAPAAALDTTEAAAASAETVSVEGDAAVAEAPVAAEASAELGDPATAPESSVEAPGSERNSEELAAGEVVADEAAAPAAKAELPPLAPTEASVWPETKHEAPEAEAIFRGRVVAASESRHVAIVNRAVDVEAARQLIERAASTRERVWGLVFGFNRGGFDVLVEGVRVFCPASSIDADTPHNPVPWLGRKLQFHVSSKRPKGSDYVVTRRSLAEREARRRAGERLKSLKAGAKLSGTVKSIKDFAVILDLDGIDGFLHVSELSWDRAAKPDALVKLGEVLDVEVLRIEAPSKTQKRAKISLTRKPFLDDPWGGAEEALSPGLPRDAKVLRVAPFGAFLELAPGIEGLLHESEFPTDAGRQVKPEPGQMLRVVVDKVDRKQRRIGLSRLSAAELAALEAGATPDPAKAKSIKVGAQVEVIIDKSEPKGLNVRVDGVFGKRGRGYLLRRELGDQGAGDTRKTLAAGAKLSAKVVGFEKDGRLRLSCRALALDEERRAVQAYRKEASKQGLGTFADLLKAKLDQGA